MVRNFRLVRDTWTTSDDFETAVHLHRVSVDYFAVEFLSNENTKLRFTACSRSAKYNYRLGTQSLGILSATKR